MNMVVEFWNYILKVISFVFFTFFVKMMFYFWIYQETKMRENIYMMNII